ncbi:MAG: TonB-dependent receptor [Gammaproteobacteria bacterium]|nr:TonB-dependent receptor [Gammaproteobacteria bacterium]
MVEFSSRIVDNDTRSRRLAGGLRWRYRGSGIDLHLARHETEAEERVRNVLSGPALQLALGPRQQCTAAPGCVPVNLFGPPGSIDAAMLDWIGIDIASEARLVAGQHLAGRVRHSGGAAGRPGRIRPGCRVAARGAGHPPDPRARNQQVVAANNFGGTHGRRDIAELYGELLVPLLAGRPGAELLELQIASRYSDYSDFGRTRNPRLSLRWRPVAQLLIRSTLAQGFRAPTLRELHLTEQQSADFLLDPCAQADRVAELPGCSLASDPTLTQFLTLTGGNPELNAEQSRSFTLGMLWTPQWVPGHLRASVDYYEIEQENVVDSSAQFVVDENARSGRFPDRVVRDASGNIRSVTATNINIGRRSVSGADLRLDWQLPPTRLGVFELAANAAHIRHFRDQLDPAMPAQDRAGTFSDAASEGNGALPHWKANFGIHWTLGGWSARYGLHHVASLDERVPGTERRREIDDWTIHNIQFSHGWLTATAEARVTLGLNNVLDRAAPFSAAAFNDSHDSRTHDLIGRFLYARLSAESLIACAETSDAAGPRVFPPIGTIPETK